MLVGQAPGPHEVEDRRPFAYTAGRRLFGWFADRFGIAEQDFRAGVHMCAVIRCFPGKDPKNGGDRVPDPVEIANCGAHLDREFRLLRPRLVIAVGTLASAQLIGIAQLKSAVGRLHRAGRAGHSFDVVVLPHPSGRSTWLNNKENAEMLERSLALIGNHEAFRASIAAPSRSSSHSKESRAHPPRPSSAGRESASRRSRRPARQSTRRERDR